MACRNRAPVRSKACFMDDLLREFLTETSESLDTVDNQLVKFEQEPNNAKILYNIFRLVHTIKGTCGFLGLSRLEALTHAAETLMGKFRDGMPVTADAVTLTLSTLDRVKTILDGIETEQREPAGSDADLIEQLGCMARGESVKPQAAPPSISAPDRAPSDKPTPERTEDRRSEDDRRAGADRRGERAESADKPATEA